MDLLSLHAILLHYHGLWNILYTIRVFHTALLLIKELFTANEVMNGPTIMKLTRFTMSPMILKQLA